MPALEFAVQRRRHGKYLLHRPVRSPETQDWRYKVLDDPCIEGVTPDRNTSGRDDAVLGSRAKLNQTEIARATAEISDQYKFARGQTLRVRVRGSDRFVFKIDMFKPRNRISAA